MSGSTLPALTPASALTGSEEVYVVQGGADRRTTTQAIANLALTATQIGALDLSTLPTSDPGGGRLWLNGGVLQVGP